MKAILLGTLLLQALNVHAQITPDPEAKSTSTLDPSETSPVFAAKISNGKNRGSGGGNPWPITDDNEGVGDWDGEDVPDEADWPGNGPKKQKKGKGGKGQDDDDDGEECPKWCQYSDDAPDDDNEDYNDGPILTMPNPFATTTRRGTGPRPTWPAEGSAPYIPRAVDVEDLNLDRAPVPTETPGQMNGFQFPKKKHSSAPVPDDSPGGGDDGGEDGVDNEDDMPSWASTSKSKKKSKGKKKCPKKCRKPHTTSVSLSTAADPTGKKTKTGKKTVTRTITRPAKSSRTPYPPYTYTPPASTEDPVQPTETATTLVTTVVPPAFTGPSLADTCPKPCNPFNPAENKCDITTSCTTTGGKGYYCACRAGYRADGYNPKDFKRQMKVPGLPYVYVEEGVACGTLCGDQTCEDVLERPKCKL